jgi:hypothetical protein
VFPAAASAAAPTGLLEKAFMNPVVFFLPSLPRTKSKESFLILSLNKPLTLLS